MKRKILIAIASLLTCNLSMASLTYGGADVGNGTRGEDPRVCIGEIQLCYQSVGRILNAHKRLALLSLETGSMAEARASLLAGLQTANNFLRQVPNYKPLTLESIDRGMNLDRAFRGLCNRSNPDTYKSCIDNEDRIASMFLASYYEHILTRIAPLDERYYSYYDSCSYYNDRNWWQAFIINYKTAASDLLDLISGQSVNYSLPRSLQFDSYEAAVQVIILRAVAHDLSRENFREYFDYPVGDLLAEADYLERLLTGNYNSRALSISVLGARKLIIEVRNWLNAYNYNYRETNYHRQCQRRGIRY